MEEYTRNIGGKLYTFTLKKIKGSWFMVEKTTGAPFPLGRDARDKKKEVVEVAKILGYTVKNNSRATKSGKRKRR